MYGDLKGMKKAGYFSIIGAAFMVVGAAFWGASGSDLWAALATSDIEIFIYELPQAKTLLIVNTCFWIPGVLLMGTALMMMDDLNNENKAASAVLRMVIGTAIPMAIVSFITMLSLAITLSPDVAAQSVQLATTIGWIGARIDDIATILIVGVSPFFVSLAGRGVWVPGWLRIWGFVAASAGLLALIALLIPQAYELGFIIIPVGLGWMIAAGIVLLRKVY
jgi:hypothetical protein